MIPRLSSSKAHCACHILPFFWSRRMKLYMFFVGYSVNRPFSASAPVARGLAFNSTSPLYESSLMVYCTCQINPFRVSSFRNVQIFSVGNSRYLTFSFTSCFPTGFCSCLHEANANNTIKHAKIIFFIVRRFLVNIKILKDSISRNHQLIFFTTVGYMRNNSSITYFSSSDRGMFVSHELMSKYGQLIA